MSGRQLILIFSLIIGLLLVYALLFRSSEPPKLLVKIESLPQLILSDFPVNFWETGNFDLDDKNLNRSWINQFQLECNDSNCTPYEFKGSTAGKVGFEIWKLLAKAALSNIYKTTGKPRDQIASDIKNSAAAFLQEIKNNNFGADAGLALGLHLFTLDQIQVVFPDTQELSSLFYLGGDTLLFRVEFEFEKRYLSEDPMILGMMARSLSTLSIHLKEKNDVPSDSTILRGLTNNPEALKILANRAKLAAEKVLKYAFERLNKNIDSAELGKNSGLCWVGLAELEINKNLIDTKDKPNDNSILEQLNTNIVSNDNFLYEGSQLNEAAACLELLYNSCKENNQQSCQNLRLQLSKTVNNYWDSPKNPICNGDGLFVTRSRHLDSSCSKNFKSLDSNAQMMNLISVIR